MRTEILWNEKVKEKVLQRYFPPRLQQDLRSIPAPALPELESIYVFGKTGYGKSVYTAFMFLEHQKQKYLNNETGKDYFISMSQLLQELKDDFTTNTGVLEKYQTAELLVLDDFGTTKPSAWLYDTLYLIINHRYEYMLNTIISSNLSLTEVEQIFGDTRITSRIERMCKITSKKHYNR